MWIIEWVLVMKGSKYDSVLGLKELRLVMKF